MNVFLQEWKRGIKPFVLWGLGIAFLIFAAMMKFRGVVGTESGAVTGMLAAFPKPVLAMLGMAEANIETYGGFFSVLQFYAMVVICCYAVYLGTVSVLRETIDKTYEFLFTKPCGRLHILSMKLLSGFVWLTLICLLNGVFSYLAPAAYAIDNTIADTMLLFFIAVYLVALLLYALSAMLAVVIRGAERAIRASYAVFLGWYALSVFFDVDTRFEFVRPLTPLKYFRAGELLAGRLNPWYVAVVLVAVVVCVAVACTGFQRKDLTAVS